MPKSAQPGEEEAPWLLYENAETVDLLCERWGLWARPRILYKRARSAEGNWHSPQVFGMPNPKPKALQLFPDDRFGWMVECAWRTLPDADRWLLAEWYVNLHRDAFSIRKACRKAGIRREQHQIALQQAMQAVYRSYLTLIAGSGI